VKTTDRDKMIMLVLPAAAVLLIYFFFLRPKDQTELDKAQKELKSVQAKSPTPLLLQQKTVRLAQLNHDLQASQEQQASLQRKWEELTGTGAEAARRSERIEQLAAMLKQHGLTVIEQGHAEGGKDATLPRELEPISKRFSAGHGPQVWRFRVSGNYASLLAAIGKMSDGESAVIPLGLTMKEANLLTDTREWTLLVWI